MFIYVYEDKHNDDRVVYIGKDKSFNHRRHKDHLTSKTPTKFERKLQAYPNRYTYKRIIQVLDEDWYNDLEAILIWVLKKLGCADHNLVDELDYEIRLALEEK